MYEIIFNSQDHHLLCLRLITSKVKIEKIGFTVQLHCQASVTLSLLTVA